MRLDSRIRERVTALIEKGHLVIATHQPNAPDLIGFPTLNHQGYVNWQSQALAFLTNLLGSDHVYTQSFTENTKSSGYKESVHAGIGILQAVLEDIDQGLIETVRQLIAAEVFSDFFEQASYLLDNGYTIPAASLAGAVLENGLRSIANRTGVRLSTRDDLSALNQKLGNKTVYNRLVQKKVSVWIDVRNAADHGQFDVFEDNDVRDLIKGSKSLLADLL